MDDQAVEQNQQTLGDLLENGDKKFVALVGVTALAIMAEQLAPQDYQAFLSKCIEKAHELQKYKALNARQPKQTTQPASSPAEGNV